MENVRKSIHYTPQKGWINDPNGLVYVDGNYHIFCQHYPDDTKWGPMHWSHATTKDFIHYDNQPIALYPSDEEYIFSGSSIIDIENLSGFGDDKHKAMLLFYTGHNKNTGEQMQNLVYSTDYVHFIKYELNPIIKNNISDKCYKKDFRDPKVFKNEKLGGYSMIVSAGAVVEFYHSKNMLEWEFTGSFNPEEFGYSGICECPDLICLDDMDSSKYVLIMSTILLATEDEEESHVMQYFVGQFDGNTFLCKQDKNFERLLDFGKDNYAMVSFSNTDKCIMLGWGENWNDARINTATNYFGKLTLPREVSLQKIEDDYFVKQKPYIKNEFLMDENVWKKEISLSVGEKLHLTKEVCIENKGEYLHIYGKVIKRKIQGESKIQAFYDNGYIEIFADDGFIVFSRNLQEDNMFRFCGDLSLIKPKDEAFKKIQNPIDLYEKLKNVWCEYTCAPRLREKWSVDDITNGQCSVTSFLAQDIFGGEVHGVLTENGNIHCYNVCDGIWFDLTSEQFGEEADKLQYNCDNLQERNTPGHFGKIEKKERYEYLKKALLEFLENEKE